MAYSITSLVKEKSDLAPKNRVWDFLGERQRFAYRIDPQALQPCRENRLRPTKTVSDVYVGLNLYGFVGNDGVNFWDYLGLDRWIENTAAAPLNSHKRICVTAWKPSEELCTECLFEDTYWEKDGKYCISFGVPKEAFGGGYCRKPRIISDGVLQSRRSGVSDLNPKHDGVIYEDLVDKAEKEGKRVTQSCSQDIKDKRILSQLVGQTGNFDFFSNNCRDFSEGASDFLDEYNSNQNSK